MPKTSLYVYQDGRVGGALSLLYSRSGEHLLEPARLTPNKMTMTMPDGTKYRFKKAKVDTVSDGYVGHVIKTDVNISIEYLELHLPTVPFPPEEHKNIIEIMEKENCGEPGMVTWCYPVCVYNRRNNDRACTVWTWHLRYIADDHNITTVIETNPSGGHTVHVGRHLNGPLRIAYKERVWNMKPLHGGWNHSAEGYLYFVIPPSELR